MARGYRSRRSYFNAGGSGNTEEKGDWEPKVDKNPFYRTMDIFNGVFKKKIKLSPGKMNSTDLKTIFVNFGELKPSRIAQVLREGKEKGKAIYELECGHEWEGKTTNKDGGPKVIGKDWGMCGICGAEQIYRGFEHEWQHIIFKSDLAARKIFCQQQAELLHKDAPQVPKEEIEGFLSLLVNAFDDLRVNSLWEKVYPGSALAIWDRWRYLTHRRGEDINNDFLSFIFATAFGLPTDPQSEFAPMRPVIEWAVQKVKYRGFSNMLIDIRVVIDRCMGALLARIPPSPSPGAMPPPPPPPIQQPIQPNNPSNAGSGVQQGNTQGTQQTFNFGGQDSGQQQDREDDQQAESESQGDSGQDQGSDSSDQQALSGSQEGPPDEEMEEEGEDFGGEEGGEQQEVRGSNGASSGQGLGHIPSAKDVQANEQEKEEALRKLMAGAEPLDEEEEHAEPSAEDLDALRNSQVGKLMLARAMGQDIKDLHLLDQKLPTGEVDDDMQQQIDQLKNSVANKSENSQLTDGAKAKIVLIDVTQEGTGITRVELDNEEKFFVQRMRSAFYRAMGRQKAKRSPNGNAIDVQALIQYLGDHQDPNVFENEDVNQGFAYSMVCDMSGSMSSAFGTVCHATEMLKEALHFPFVMGNLWGFRGGERVSGRDSWGDGEVWMYRYANNVDWYTGTTPVRVHSGYNGVVNFPVRCGGITPMNSAINVAATHLWKKMPTGMAKRMFLLTDGSPVQTRLNGQQMPEFMLRQFVAKEIRVARRHGIQVYTIVIGNHSIEDDKCLQMFGPRKFWRKVDHENVGSILASMVLANFSKYIRARG